MIKRNLALAISCFILYNIFLLLAFPFIFFYFLFRLAKKKDTLKSFYQKLSLRYFLILPLFFSGKKYDIWFHAASVGELRSLNFLISRAIEHGKQILITTTTIKSAEIARNYDRKFVTHKFLPLDFLIFQILFIIKNRAKKLIIADSEIWINLFIILRIFSVKIFLFNARISIASQKRWSKFPDLFKYVISSVGIIMPQSRSEQAFFEKYHTNTKYFGNLKMLNLSLDKQFLPHKNIADFVQNSKILCIVSTHDGEDELIIRQILHLKNQYQIVYSPRHPHRSQDISKILQKNGITNSLLSQYSKGNDCLVVDAIGMLDSVFLYSEIVIFGGAFLPHLSGHNIMEAAAFGCKIITGNFVETFREIIDEMRVRSAILQCDIENLGATVDSIISNSDIGQNAKKYIAENMPNMQEIIDIVES